MVAAWDRDPRTYDQRLDDAVRRLVEALHPERIYLFGSRARGDYADDSDWDLMVVVPESQSSSIRRAQNAYHAVLDVPIPMDILVWTREEFDRQVPVVASLPAVITREGRLLYGSQRREDPTGPRLAEEGAP